MPQNALYLREKKGTFLKLKILKKKYFFEIKNSLKKSTFLKLKIF